MLKKLVVLNLLMFLPSLGLTSMAADEMNCWFPPAWQSRVEQADRIADSLTRGSGITVRAKVAASYPEILEAFASDEQNLVYIGSFVQSILVARKLGRPLLQAVDGHQMYAGILITRAGADPSVILGEHPERIAYTIGTSSGESSAKAATAGKAGIGVKSHADAVAAVQQGRASGAFVKDWWWELSRVHYPGLESHLVAGVSIQMNPDDVLSASRSVSAETSRLIKAAAMADPEAFGPGTRMREFTPGQLAFPLGLMRKGGMDPLTYSW